MNDSDGTPSDVYVPEYSFTYNGKQYTVAAKTYSNMENIEVGATVPLKIDPEHPETILDTNRERKLMAFVSMILALFWVLGVGALIVSLIFGRG